jgi:hypothetical protein
MSREQIPLRPIQIDFRCNACGIGFMRPQGNILMSNPPLFSHACNHCGEEETFQEKYPTVRFAKEGELLDLDNYVQQSY